MRWDIALKESTRTLSLFSHRSHWQPGRIHFTHVSKILSLHWAGKRDYLFHSSLAVLICGAIWALRWDRGPRRVHAGRQSQRKPTCPPSCHPVNPTPSLWAHLQQILTQYFLSWMVYRWNGFCFLTMNHVTASADSLGSKGPSVKCCKLSVELELG